MEEALDHLAKASGRHSLFKGVTLYRPTSKWRAQISHGGRTVTLGDYATEEEAARTFDRACICKNGVQAATTNFPVADYRSQWAQLEGSTITQLLAVLKEERHRDRAAKESADSALQAATSPSPWARTPRPQPHDLAEGPAAPSAAEAAAGQQRGWRQQCEQLSAAAGGGIPQRAHASLLPTMPTPGAPLDCAVNELRPTGHQSPASQVPVRGAGGSCDSLPGRGQGLLNLLAARAASAPLGLAPLEDTRPDQLHSNTAAALGCDRGVVSGALLPGPQQQLHLGLGVLPGAPRGTLHAALPPRVLDLTQGSAWLGSGQLHRQQQPRTADPPVLLVPGARMRLEAGAMAARAQPLQLGGMLPPSPPRRTHPGSLAAGQGQAEGLLRPYLLQEPAAAGQLSQQQQRDKELLLLLLGSQSTFGLQAPSRGTAAAAAPQQVKGGAFVNSWHAQTQHEREVQHFSSQDGLPEAPAQEHLAAAGPAGEQQGQEQQGQEQQGQLLRLLMLAGSRGAGGLDLGNQQQGGARALPVAGLCAPQQEREWEPEQAERQRRQLLPQGDGGPPQLQEAQLLGELLALHACRYDQEGDQRPAPAASTALLLRQALAASRASLPARLGGSDQHPGEEPPPAGAGAEKGGGLAGAGSDRAAPQPHWEEGRSTLPPRRLPRTYSPQAGQGSSARGLYGAGPCDASGSSEGRGVPHSQRSQPPGRAAGRLPEGAPYGHTHTAGAAAGRSAAYAATPTAGAAAGRSAGEVLESLVRTLLERERGTGAPQHQVQGGHQAYGAEQHDVWEQPLPYGGAQGRTTAAGGGGPLGVDERPGPAVASAGSPAAAGDGWGFGAQDAFSARGEQLSDGSGDYEVSRVAAEDLQAPPSARQLSSALLQQQAAERPPSRQLPSAAATGRQQSLGSGGSGGVPTQPATPESDGAGGAEDALPAHLRRPPPRGLSWPAEASALHAGSGSAQSGSDSPALHDPPTRSQAPRCWRVPSGLPKRTREAGARSLAEHEHHGYSGSDMEQQEGKRRRHHQEDSYHSTCGGGSAAAGPAAVDSVEQHRTQRDFRSAASALSDRNRRHETAAHAAHSPQHRASPPPGSAPLATAREARAAGSPRAAAAAPRPQPQPLLHERERHLLLELLLSAVSGSGQQGAQP